MVIKASQAEHTVVRGSYNLKEGKIVEINRILRFASVIGSLRFLKLWVELNSQITPKILEN